MAQVKSKKSNKCITYIDPEIHRMCKIIALLKGTTISAYVEYCIKKVIKEEGYEERINALV